MYSTLCIEDLLHVKLKLNTNIERPHSPIATESQRPAVVSLSGAGSLVRNYRSNHVLPTLDGACEGTAARGFARRQICGEERSLLAKRVSL